jgi:predicted RND superfamily exporter protein
MKKILLCLILLFIISCKEKPRNFYGFGEIKLDSIFKNLPSEKQFKKLSENEFKIDTFKLSEKIGFVKNLVIKTDDEKIYDVSFDCMKTTNIRFIDSLMKNVTELKSLNNVENKSLPIQFYEQSDGKVIFSKTIEKKDSLVSYRYCDIQKMLEFAK